MSLLPLPVRRWSLRFCGLWSVIVGSLLGFGWQPDACGQQADAPGILPKLPAAGAAGSYRDALSHVSFSAHVEPKVATAGGSVKLLITATPDADWHVYGYLPNDPSANSKPTLIALPGIAGWDPQRVTPSVPPRPSDEPGKLPYYKEPVTWSIELPVPATAPNNQFEIAGMIGFQTCVSGDKCDPPSGVQFRAVVPIAATAEPGPLPVTFAGKAKYKDIAKAMVGEPTTAPSAPTTTSQQPAPAAGAAFDLSKINVSAEDETPLPFYSAIGLALLGGFVLNFMPCVLPVIGLKVMSFMQQAGHDRRKAFLLNVWYSLGLLFVFIVLATLAVVFNFGWGQQNQYGAFNITMAAIVFAMGLSFLGVWEIPIPGFAGSSKAAELSEQEGPTGAFLKGIITTILAVPCSGPGVATALTWCTGKPPFVVYGVFACMALGMASPYLVIGANPQLMRFIPKPGEWMETFKEVMGFVLLATVVFILSYLPWVDVLPTVSLLFGIWAGCWLIGRLPAWAEANKKLVTWSAALAFIAAIAVFSFTKFRSVMEDRFEMAADLSRQKAVKAGPKLDWQPFSLSRLQQLTAEGKTVLVDFTADWCVTCKTLEATVLKTQPIQQKLKDNNVVTLIADWTDTDEEITKTLEALGSKQVPVLAIFPAKAPFQPVAARGWYTSSKLTAMIEAAGPSAVKNQ